MKKHRFPVYLALLGALILGSFALGFVAARPLAVENHNSSRSNKTFPLSWGTDPGPGPDKGKPWVGMIAVSPENTVKMGQMGGLVYEVSFDASGKVMVSGPFKDEAFSALIFTQVNDALTQYYGETPVPGPTPTATPTPTPTPGRPPTPAPTLAPTLTPAPVPLP